MMLPKKLGNRVAGTIISVALFFTISPGVLAAEFHEDPETAEVIFSGISLLRYYSAALDLVLQKNPAEVEARLQKLPLANIPPELAAVTASFAASSIGLSRRVVRIEQYQAQFRALLAQSRLDEAIQLADEILAQLSQANNELDKIEAATVVTGRELEVFSAPRLSDLRRSYDEVLERIGRLREMLDADKNVLAQLYITAVESFRLTEITLNIAPMVAFVGDNISFSGRLTSGNRPLVRREVNLLLNSSQYVTASTDATGYFQAEFPVPYWYLPELDLQVLYYPQGKDIGFYLASLSPERKLQVLFYPAELKIEVADQAYRGRETTVTGQFDYRQSPPLSQRRVEIYLDNVLMTEVQLQEAFAQKIKIAPEIAPGQHTLTLSAAAAQRYAPVVASAMLEVTRATPMLELSLPKVAIIPGSVSLSGRLSSELGPVSEASIKLGLSNAQMELVGSESGTFDTRMGMGMTFGLIGAQDLAIRVIPQEAWHAPLSTTSRLLVVNIVNCGIFLLLLVFLSLYLPGKLSRWGRYPAGRARPAVASPTALAPVASRRTPLAAVAESGESGGEPRQRIFYWYRLAVRLILGISQALLKPQQTLGEFAREHSQVLGLKAKYFIELTRMVERLLYSQYRPTGTDVENSERLSRQIEESKPEAIK